MIALSCVCSVPNDLHLAYLCYWSDMKVFSDKLVSKKSCNQNSQGILYHLKVTLMRTPQNNYIATSQVVQFHPVAYLGDNDQVLLNGS